MGSDTGNVAPALFGDVQAADPMQAIDMDLQIRAEFDVAQSGVYARKRPPPRVLEFQKAYSQANPFPAMGPVTPPVTLALPSQGMPLFLSLSSLQSPLQVVAWSTAKQIALSDLYFDAIRRASIGMSRTLIPG